MTKWEYKVYNEEELRELGDQEVQFSTYGAINYLGKDGWELIDVASITYTEPDEYHNGTVDINTNLIYYFKRPLVAEKVVHTHLYNNSISQCECGHIRGDDEMSDTFTAGF